MKTGRSVLAGRRTSVCDTNTWNGAGERAKVRSAVWGPLHPLSEAMPTLLLFPRLPPPPPLEQWGDCRGNATLAHHLYIYIFSSGWLRSESSIKEVRAKILQFFFSKKSIRHVDCSALCPSDVNNVLIGRCWSTRMRRVPALTPDIVIVALFLVAEKCRAKFIH